MRSIVHALRGWPTPLGVPINTLEPNFDEDGRCLSSKLQDQLNTLPHGIVEFARHRAVAHREA
jgi:FMN reductase